jgi:hypothetical protein
MSWLDYQASRAAYYGRRVAMRLSFTGIAGEVLDDSLTYAMARDAAHFGRIALGHLVIVELSTLNRDYDFFPEAFNEP